ncbi:type II toxin-antitoxin system RelE family toxin [Mucilaginibacter glaciei]|uniref:Type II toxin-antitoxin system RelE/ParE family toxin n=1 Tax=Mucilaginibacter glaciei TaxID=2772109 RepID=A0A926S550_9SPHI|nr:type II toxin-antitoxin system RelE/ParE family toxin [Mucilaginibacter glaciei]
MPKYTAILSKTARKELDKLSDHIANPIIDAITYLEINPRPLGYRKLVDREGYRIRVGNYRITYDIIDDQLIINIITLGHRKYIYR